MTESASQQWSPPGPGVAAIICTFDEDRLTGLRKSLSAIGEQLPRPDEIILVVNDNPSLADTLRSTISGVRVLENDRQGISHARDLGAGAATAEILAFIDDDATPRPGWLAGLVRPFADDRVMMTSGRIEPRWETHQPRWFPPEFLWVVGCSYRGLPEDGATLRNPIGASMAIRRSVVEATGSFESHLGRIGTDGSGCEETEFAIRAHRLLPGRTVTYVTTSVVDHYVPEHRTSLSYFTRRCWKEGRSKAILVALSSAEEGLSAERAFLRSTIVRGLATTARRPARWDRLGAMVLGLVATGGGYLVGRITLRPLHRSA